MEAFIEVTQVRVRPEYHEGTDRVKRQVKTTLKPELIAVDTIQHVQRGLNGTLIDYLTITPLGFTYRDVRTIEVAESYETIKGWLQEKEEVA